PICLGVPERRTTVHPSRGGWREDPLSKVASAWDGDDEVRESAKAAEQIAMASRTTARMRRMEPSRRKQKISLRDAIWQGNLGRRLLHFVTSTKALSCGVSATLG